LLAAWLNLVHQGATGFETRIGLKAADRAMRNALINAFAE